MAIIRVTSGTTAGATLEIAGPTVIGRESCDLVLPDTEVSRQHAKLTPQDDGIEVEDLGSMNGTFVNGKKIEGPVRLTASAMLRVGVTELALEVPPPATVSDAPAPADVTVARPTVPAADVTVARDVEQGDAAPAPDVTVARDVQQGDVAPPPDVTVARETVPAPGQPDVTAVRPVVGAPEATVQRKTQPGPASGEAATGAKQGSGLPPPPVLIAIGVAVAVVLLLLLFVL